MFHWNKPSQEHNKVNQMLNTEDMMESLYNMVQYNILMHIYTYKKRHR